MYVNPPFRAKVILLALVGLNSLIFCATIYRRVHEWEVLSLAPTRAHAAYRYVGPHFHRPCAALLKADGVALTLNHWDLPIHVVNLAASN